MKELTAFQRDLLCVISGLDKPHGVAVKDEIEEYYGREIPPGRLYPNLDELVKADLVSKGQHDLRTNAYILTEQGKQRIATHEEWISNYRVANS
ncbi:helix-turn-helix transcriptional regulator [Halalkalicoccus tibetensis]|uniref:Helix-turn-helix transcriptional regulator n=1 Tax=Halalkalicoccus tibetensis TaxID=175632 RepID=A0ABD5V8C4_9EURY